MSDDASTPRPPHWPPPEPGPIDETGSGRTDPGSAGSGASMGGIDSSEPATIERETRRRHLGRHKVRVARLTPSSWPGIFKRTAKGFSGDELTDRAAALTYYSVLSIFPGLIALVSFLRLFGAKTSSSLVKNIVDLVPGGVGTTVNNMINTVNKTSQSSALLIAVLSILGSLWSASGYVGAFMRASNDIYDVPEGRPFWKTAPVKVVLTILSGVILTAGALAVVVTGNLARAVGDAMGVGHAAVDVWNIVKWPVLVVIIALLFAALYWAGPNARGRYRPLGLGSLAAVVGWVIASGLFAWYVANFGNYNRVYGSLASAIVFLIWLWISNLALLLGAELDSEIRRARQIAAGHPSDHEPYLTLRDTRKLKEPVVEPAVRAYK